MPKPMELLGLLHFGMAIGSIENAPPTLRRRVKRQITVVRSPQDRRRSHQGRNTPRVPWPTPSIHIVGSVRSSFGCHCRNRRGSCPARRSNDASKAKLRDVPHSNQKPLGPATIKTCCLSIQNHPNCPTTAIPASATKPIRQKILNNRRSIGASYPLIVRVALIFARHLLACALR